MATALNMPMSVQPAAATVDILPTELRSRHQCLAEITEMIHVSSFFPFHPESCIVL